MEEHYRWGLEQGYSGAWDWSMIGGDGNDDGALCAAGMAALAGEAKVRAVRLGADPGETEDTCRGVADTRTLYTVFHPLVVEVLCVLFLDYAHWLGQKQNT